MIIIRTILFGIRIFLFSPLYLLFLFSQKKEIILLDIQRMYDKGRTPYKGILGLLYLLINNTFFRRVYYTRVGEISLLLSWLYPAEPTFKMCSNIGPGIYVAHPFATIINAKSVGVNLSIRNNTTIGNKREGDMNSRPIIGDNVSIGANVVIIGDIVIGNNVMIGAGSVVVKDIPDNSVVAGNPAKIIKIRM